jgi:hypothetical protein
VGDRQQRAATRCGMEPRGDEASVPEDGMEVFMIAALYVDTRRGPYPHIPGVVCWGIEEDATKYQGPWPVVAHPPCGHWGRYAHKAHDDGHTGPIAVHQVRLYGGVLEQPKDSKLFSECGLPKPGELPDAWGGFTLLVCQRDWGHAADKPTWLYIVGIDRGDIPGQPPEVEPKRQWKNAKRVLKTDLADPQRRRGTRGVLECLSKNQRHLTPPLFAAWLVEIARRYL